MKIIGILKVKRCKVQHFILREKRYWLSDLTFLCLIKITFTIFLILKIKLQLNLIIFLHNFYYMCNKIA
jgi:hypothetical protein